MCNTNDRNTAEEEIWWLDVTFVEFEMKARNAIRSILKVGRFIKPKCKERSGSEMQIGKSKKMDNIKIETAKMLSKKIILR